MRTQLIPTKPPVDFFSFLCASPKARWIARPLVALMGAIATPALAADVGEDALTESTFLAELPKVLSASRLSQPLSKAPSAVSIIDREMIEASGATNVAELLRLVPGFLVAERRGEQYTTAYRALGSEYTRYLQVLVDGVSIYQVYFGEVHWWTLPVPVEDVERIEVVRSPNAAAYGSNSFQAVINIITRNPAEAKGGRLVLQSGTHDFQRGLVSYNGGNELVDFRATLGYKKNTGFSDVADTTRVPFMLLRGDVHLGTRDELQLQFGQSDTRYEDGSPRNIESPVHPAKILDQFFQMRWSHDLGQGSDMSLQYARSRFRLTDEWSIMLDTLDPLIRPFMLAKFGYQAAPNYPISLNYEGGRDSLEFTHRFNPSPSTKLAWGIEARRDYVESDTWFYSDKYLRGDLTRLFANGEWQATRNLTLNAGAMLEKHYFTDANLYPRLAANYALSPEQTLRTSISKGFRPPTFGERKGDERFYLGPVLLYQRFSSDPNGVQPETVTSRDIGYLGEWRDIGLTLDARVSVDNYRNMISTTTTTNPAAAFNQEVLMFQNNFDLDVSSAEVQARWQASKNNLVVANYAHSRITSNWVEAERSGPLNIGSLMVSHRFSPALSASATYYRYGSMDWLGGGNAISKYERLDMKLGWKLRPGHNQDELALIVKNVLGRDNISFDKYNIERPSAFLALSIYF